nr:hypothetical protein BaRGS_032719 [Batillaria attramentaria]
MASTKYDNGYFYLHLPNPVKGGNYTCILPANVTATACVSTGAGLSPQSAIFVDKMEARLTLLEAKNMALEQKISMYHGDDRAGLWLKVDDGWWTDTMDNNTVVLACAGQDASLPWTFSLESGETIQDIKWNYRQGSRDEEMVAMSVADAFHVTQEPEAVYDTTTDSWHIALKCGIVANVNLWSDDVLWQTPSGDLSSTKYENGYFYLHLPNPVKGGNYTCILPANVTATACVSTGAGLSPQSAIFVDRVEARLTLLEAENMALKQYKGKLGPNASGKQAHSSKVPMPL